MIQFLSLIAALKEIGKLGSHTFVKKASTIKGLTNLLIHYPLGSFTKLMDYGRNLFGLKCACVSIKGPHYASEKQGRFELLQRMISPGIPYYACI